MNGIFICVFAEYRGKYLLENLSMDGVKFFHDFLLKFLELFSHFLHGLLKFIKEFGSIVLEALKLLIEITSIEFIIFLELFKVKFERMSGM